MSERYPGGFISKNAPTVSTSGAQGVWTLEQQAAYQKAGQWPFGGPFNYIEDVFSTYLYSGNSSTQTITNGIDLSGKGGLVWLKTRSVSQYHYLFDTSRGPLYALSTNATDQSYSIGNTVTAFNSNGFNLGLNSATNGSGDTFVSWTFRKQPKFFDVVTYTGNGSSTQVINHSLGARPGAIFFKKVSSTSNWVTYNRVNDTTTFAMFLNKTDAALGISNSWMTSTDFTAYQLGADTGFAADNMNDNGATYVAYLFAHNAGGFGTAGTDNVISCGSFTAGNTSTPTVVNLGFEPQWVLIKRTTGGDPYYVEWRVFDVMRGMPNPSGARALYPNQTWAESSADAKIFPTATGFSVLFDGVNISGNNFIYIAIRRGPMKTPTSGTSVFNVQTYTGNNASNRIITTNFPIDANLTSSRNSTANPCLGARLFDGMFETYDTGIPYASLTDWIDYDSNTGYTLPTAYQYSNNSSYNYVSASFRRAPSFHDVVCYSGTGSATTINHNLGVAPELIIVRRRNQAGWNGAVYASGSAGTLLLDQTSGAYTSGYYAGCFTSTNATTFGVNTIGEVNGSGGTYVAWMWASCPGVSKVGSYTGTGATQTIACGFAAQFVLIKRTDGTGNWWVWDTARGMVAGTDPRIQLNTTTAEQNANWVYTDASGFQIVTTDATVNASGGTYIFLAIA